ncbi:hypothetical protein KIPB_008657 [Kipferlia bialata]|uniref:Uncharacterized protein n=1 Tax=Kipferlia bialata TaxID=797122 RepID=A0A9K3D0D4_9EUKA|nr:hypothetical protein KIPB_008657 [Kipferlia bialata]|eukprot:g8657.t1
MSIEFSDLDEFSLWARNDMGYTGESLSRGELSALFRSDAAKFLHSLQKCILPVDVADQQRQAVLMHHEPNDVEELRRALHTSESEESDLSARVQSHAQKALAEGASHRARSTYLDAPLAAYMAQTNKDTQMNTQIAALLHRTRDKWDATLHTLRTRYEASTRADLTPSVCDACLSQSMAGYARQVEGEGEGEAPKGTEKGVLPEFDCLPPSLALRALQRSLSKAASKPLQPLQSVPQEDTDTDRVPAGGMGGSALDAARSHHIGVVARLHTAERDLAQLRAEEDALMQRIREGGEGGDAALLSIRTDALRLGVAVVRDFSLEHGSALDGLSDARHAIEVGTRDLASLDTQVCATLRALEECLAMGDGVLRHGRRAVADTANPATHPTHTKGVEREGLARPTVSSMASRVDSLQSSLSSLALSTRQVHALGADHRLRPFRAGKAVSASYSALKAGGDATGAARGVYESVAVGDIPGGKCQDAILGLNSTCVPGGLRVRPVASVGADTVAKRRQLDSATRSAIGKAAGASVAMSARAVLGRRLPLQQGSTGTDPTTTAPVSASYPSLSLQGYRPGTQAEAAAVAAGVGQVCRGVVDVLKREREALSSKAQSVAPQPECDALLSTSRAARVPSGMTPEGVACAVSTSAEAAVLSLTTNGGDVPGGVMGALEAVEEATLVLRPAAKG